MLDKLTKPITIICGHYGAGKTNVAVNLAKAARALGRRVCVADLDVVNPYFRAADNAEELRALGVRCIIPRFANTNVDIPSIPADFMAIFDSESYSIVDVGGDDGAVALSVYKERFEAKGYDMLYVFNACRPLTSTAEEALASLRDIERISRLSVTGIVNNTNLGVETNAKTVAMGAAVCAELQSMTGIPFLGSTVMRGVANADTENVMLIENATKRLF